MHIGLPEFNLRVRNGLSLLIQHPTHDVNDLALCRARFAKRKINPRHRLLPCRVERPENISRRSPESILGERLPKRERDEHGHAGRHRQQIAPAHSGEIIVHG